MASMRTLHTLSTVLPCPCINHCFLDHAGSSYFYLIALAYSRCHANPLQTKLLADRRAVYPITCVTFRANAANTPAWKERELQWQYWQCGAANDDASISCTCSSSVRFSVRPGCRGNGILRSCEHRRCIRRNEAYRASTTHLKVAATVGVDNNCYIRQR